MRQKVVIACGLVRDASMLLFDEPLTGLDPIGIRRMRDTIVARGARRRRDPALVAPAAPGRGNLHARDHHGPRTEDGRRHGRRAGGARRSGGRRIEPRTDLPARHRPRRRRPIRGWSAPASTSSSAPREEPPARAAAPAARAALPDRRDRRRRVLLLHRLRALARCRASRGDGRAAR